MILTLGLDTQFAMVEAVTSTVLDQDFIQENKSKSIYIDFVVFVIGFNKMH